MARATLGDKSVVPWEWLVEDYSRIRDKIEAVFPIFQGFNARIKVPGGFHLANPARERIWKTPNGKANVIVFPGLDEDEYQENPDALWLSTIRSHDQYNTTIYSNNDRYRGVYNQRDVLFLNPNEMKKRELALEDRVDIHTLSSDGIERVLCGFTGGESTAMTFDTLTLSRLQFAFTIGYHILWPAYSIGIAGFIVLLNALWLLRGKAVYRDLMRFWIRLFALGFVMGVVTGVVLSYQIGANWSGFARVTGNVTGPLLVYEALTAFFLEGGFIGIVLFGEARVGRRMHFFLAAWWHLAHCSAPFGF